MADNAHAEDAVVYVVDDDRGVREGTRNLIESVGLRVQTFASAQEFLAAQRSEEPGCLVLDVRLPGLSGLELQKELGKTGDPLPIVFVTGHGDIPMTVQAMKAGAIEFLTKPYRDQQLLDAVSHAIDRNRQERKQRRELLELRARYETLTPREREVMAHVVKGLLNKQVGGELGMSETTVKFHRAQLMQKMKAESLPDLVRIAERLSGATLGQG